MNDYSDVILRQLNNILRNLCELEVYLPVNDKYIDFWDKLVVNKKKLNLLIKWFQNIKIKDE